MAGSTFVCVQDTAALEGIDWKNPMAWAHFPQVKLDTMSTFEFATMLEAKQLAFTDQEPIFWDAEGGMAVLKINSPALACLQVWSEPIDATCLADFEQFRQFLQSAGVQGIYEIAQF